MINASSPEDSGGTLPRGSLLTKLEAFKESASNMLSLFHLLTGEHGCLNPPDIYTQTFLAKQLELRLENLKKITLLFTAAIDQRSENSPRSPFQCIPPSPGVSMHELHQKNGLWTQPPPRGPHQAQRCPVNVSRHLRSSQLPPQRSQPDSIAIFPGPKDFPEKTASSPEHVQLESIQKTAIAKGYRISYAGQPSNKISLLHHPAMSIEATLQETKELFPQFSSEVSTKK